ncbi:hypothetical protein CL1_1561 [Thermococcus cleftensis]|uniref:Uncharacterized protein n=1 Tax=Thermococcus cleftensis (strain DSM 27260 / KACC 17922 / CL1) TaxID=163003 RepID=I3ZVM4_THECF|nr:hypothetical protein [Thermococcus cleftensis]AFL95758.1 hypothetical protein CL1_1561 [Thermococcus cleftensis]
MRFVTKNEAVKRSFLEDLKREGIRFELNERLGYESFVGYMLEGTLEEIRSQIDVMEGADREALLEGFTSFRESLNHILEHIKVGERFEALLQEGPWVAELLDQLTRNGAIDYQDGVIRLRDGVDVTKLRFEFKFPFNLVHSPESAERIAKQFAFADLTMEYEFEILELDIGKINALGKVAARYFPEELLLKVYFALIGRAILAGEVLKAIGDERVELEELVKGFVRASPIAIPTEKGTLVINYSPKALEEVLRFLKRQGYVEIKAGKVKKLRDLV